MEFKLYRCSHCGNIIYKVYAYKVINTGFSYDSVSEKLKFGQLTNIVTDRQNRLYIFGENRLFAVKNGEEFNEYFLNIPSDIRSVWVSPSGILFALLNNGSIYSYQDDKWEEYCQGKAGLRDIIVFPDDELYAVGILGEVSRYRDGAWEKISPKTWSQLNTIWGNGSDNFYVAGSGGTVFHYHRGSWDRIRHDSREEILCMAGSHGDGNTVYLGGTNGSILKMTNGLTTSIESGVDFDIESMWVESPESIYFSGDGGDILHLNRGIINKIAPIDTHGLSYNWESLTGNDDGVFAAGSNSTILHIKHGKVLQKIVLENLYGYQSAIAIRILCPGDTLSARMPFSPIVKRFFPYKEEYYTIDKLPGTGNYLEIFQYH